MFNWNIEILCTKDNISEFVVCIQQVQNFGDKGFYKIVSIISIAKENTSFAEKFER